MSDIRDEFGRRIVSARTRQYVGAAGTLNLGDGSAALKLEGILHAIAFARITLLGMQEGSDRAKLLERLVELLRHPVAVARRLAAERAERRELRKRLAVMGWRVFTALVPGGKAVPIAYDAKVWKLRRGRSIVAVARMWVGGAGAGPAFAKPKVITVLVVEHRETGEVVEHLNTHMLPSAERGNLPEREKAARREHYAKHAGRLAAAVRRARRRGHGVVVTMDANAARLSPLIEPLRDAGLVGWTVQDTHDSHRGIDHVLTLGLPDRRLTPRLVGAPAQVMHLRGFDHRLVTRDLYVTAPQPTLPLRDTGK